jgi:hypothetical protein
MTIDLIESEIDLFKERRQLSQVLCEGVDLVQNPFKDDFNLFIAFEFDRIYSEMFYVGLLRFLNDINDAEFTFYTLNPIPNKYFFEIFSKYRIGKIPINAAFTDYMDFLDRDPGNSPADALL